jgi:diguanylate cyclase (GGDEF)-like protein
MPEPSTPSAEKAMRTENFRMYLVTRYIAILGLCVHLVCIPLFWALDVPVLALFNVASSLAWYAGYLANERSRHSLAITLLTTEVIAHTVVAVHAVGWDAGFQNYLMGAISFTMFNSALKTRVVVRQSIGIGALYCALYAYSIRTPNSTLAPALLETFYYANVGVTFAALGMMNFFFRRASETAEQRIKELADTDPLTQLPNRRKLRELLETERRRCERSGRPFILVLADIDHFKRINDGHGHDCGDAMLRHVAGVMRKTVRNIDIVGRWGGEEFLIILPEISRSRAIEVVERMRAAIEANRLEFSGAEHTVTVTFGVASYDLDRSLDLCVKQADDALYRGKQQGRNQVRVAGSPSLTDRIARPA